jgi:hypothetical protein
MNISALTSWSRVLLDMPVVAYLVNKFPAFYETRSSIIVFIRARSLFMLVLRQVNPVRSLRYTLFQIHSSTSCLPFFFPLASSNRDSVFASHLSHACYTHRVSHSPWFDHVGVEYKLWNCLLRNFPHPHVASCLLDRNTRSVYEDVQPWGRFSPKAHWCILYAISITVATS